jgi:hypothetical protein
MVKQCLHSYRAVGAISIHLAIPATLGATELVTVFDHPAGAFRVLSRATLSLLFRGAEFEIPTGKERQYSPDSFHVKTDVLNHVLD